MESPAVQPLDQLLQMPQRRDPRAEERDLLVDQVPGDLEADGSSLAHVGAAAPVAGALKGQQAGGCCARAVDAGLAAVASGPLQDLVVRAVLGLDGDIDE